MLQDIKESIANVENLVQQNKWYDAQTLYTHTLNETTKALKEVYESEDKLNDALIADALERVAVNHEKWKLLQEEAEGKRIDNYIKDKTKEDVIFQTSLQCAYLIASINLIESNVRLNDAQINKLAAEIEELYKRAAAHKMNAETYRKEVDGMINRWNAQTANERVQLAITAGEKIFNILHGAFFKPKGSSTTTIRTAPNGKQTTTQTTSRPL